MKVHIGKDNNGKFLYELNNLTKHVAVLGTTGSGKTVMCKVLIEEALQKNIPVIAIDPKGDIASLAITDENFDFRPFVNKTEAQKIAQNYLDENLELDSVKKLSNIKTKIFTPKSNVGFAVSLMPDLKSPPHFKEIIEDPTLIANFVEPISETIMELSEIKSNVATIQSFISQILIHNWSEQKDLTINELINQVQNPPFEKLGSLDLNDVISDKDRKKVAANLNLLISSPAKRVWANGEKLDIQECMSPNNLSVFDLRHASSNHDKQLVVGVILQEIYKFLISRKGTEQLKFILYIDELAGIFPPAPANPPTKKLLELLIRQARAFGLGIILASQNPGDIDYKVLSNVGSRFIGKLRTDQDIEKVASGTEIPPSTLKGYVSRLHTGDFIYNDSIKNSTKQVRVRWLNSFHGGPLNSEQIKWINEPSTIPEVKGELELKKKTSEVEGKTKIKKIDTIEAYKSFDTKNPGELVKKLTPQVDSLKVLRSSVESRIYKPVLQLTIEAKNWRGIQMPIIGPFNYDLSKKKMLRIKNEEFIQNKLDDLMVLPIKVNVKSAVDSSINKAKKKLSRDYYKSTIFDITAKKKGDVVKVNKKYLMELVNEQSKKIDVKKKKKIDSLKLKLKSNNDKKRNLLLKLHKKRTKRALTNLLTDKNLASRTKQMVVWKRNIKSLETDNSNIKKEIDQVKKKAKTQKRKLLSVAKIKAEHHAVKIRYEPPKSHLKVDAKLLLMPEY